jgi:precorrin-2 dehydrogenase / sirohydrochlorin ferrochelatase
LRIEKTQNFVFAIVLSLPAPKHHRYNIVMGKYPIFLELAGTRVVIIGAGAVAARKIQPLLTVAAHIVVVADKIDEMMKTCCLSGNVELIVSKYQKAYLLGAMLVIAATADPAVNTLIYKDCQELEILCNVVDDPDHCDFFVPAVVKRGSLQIAIGTEGLCPAYASHLRKKLEHLFTEKHGQFLAELERLRKHIVENTPNPSDRKTLLDRLVDDESFEYFTQNGPQLWQKKAAEIMKEHHSKT